MQFNHAILPFCVPLLEIQHRSMSTEVQQFSLQFPPQYIDMFLVCLKIFSFLLNSLVFLEKVKHKFRLMQGRLALVSLNSTLKRCMLCYWIFPIFYFFSLR